MLMLFLQTWEITLFLFAPSLQIAQWATVSDFLSSLFKNRNRERNALVALYKRETVRKSLWSCYEASDSLKKVYILSLRNYPMWSFTSRAAEVCLTPASYHGLVGAVVLLLLLLLTVSVVAGVCYRYSIACCCPPPPESCCPPPPTILLLRASNI